MSYFVYVIRSEKRDYRYIGISDNPERRIEYHNSGYSKTTKPYLPFRVVLIEKYNDRQSARDREVYLKTGVGREYLDDFEGR